MTALQERAGTPAAATTVEPPGAARTALVLGAFVAIGPLTIDTYLPALPTITRELETTSAAVQLTLTGTLVGLALGQLVLGPLSDALGRRRPLLAGTALHVLASLLVLVHLQRADVFVALIIIGREIAISALREWMANIGAAKSVAVHMLGKVKTAVQMTAIPFLLFDGMLLGLIDTGIWGTWLIWASAILTVWSMVYYLQKALPEIRQRVK